MPNDQRHVYTLDKHLNDRVKWLTKRHLCLECGWDTVVVWRADTNLVCPKCSAEGRKRATVETITARIEA